MSLRLLWLCKEPPSREVVDRIVGDGRVELVTLGSVEALAGLAAEPPLGVAVIDEDLPGAASAFGELGGRFPGAELLMRSSSASPSGAELLRAMRLGARDYLRAPHLVERVHAALDRVQARLTGEGRPGEVERLRLAASAADEGAWDWEVATDTLHLSPLWWRPLGEAPVEVCHLSEWLTRAHPDDQVGLQSALARAAAGPGPRFEHEYRIRHQDGSYRWMLTRGHVLDRNGDGRRIVGSQCDVTSWKIAEEQLRKDALHDGLTGLPNQVLFRERLSQALKKRRRGGGERCAVLFLDLDRFKTVNDSLGHMVGDQLLVAFARRLEVCLRTEDTFARLGGDEFAILIEDTDAAQATQVAERIQRVLRRPFKLEHHEVFAGASIGITLGESASGAVDELIREADTAMYRAKASGRARYTFFDTEMHTSVRERLDMETDIRHAMDRREFMVYYQPIVVLGSGRLSGFEALLRWHSPTRGWVAPSDFVPVAEEMGAIVPIGHWIMRKACAQLAAWRSAFPACRSLSVAVNVSSQQFGARDLAADVAEVLEQTCLPASCLRLEVTESTIIDDMDAAGSLLDRLRGMGVRVALDDFGTGYSSLRLLNRLPFDTLKIDRSFIAGMASTRTAGIVQAIVSLARNAGLDTVAEGIESAEQAAAVRKMRCTHGQGFHFALPVEARAVWSMLAERSRRGRGWPWESSGSFEGAVEEPLPVSVPIEISYPIVVEGTPIPPRPPWAGAAKA